MSMNIKHIIEQTDHKNHKRKAFPIRLMNANFKKREARSIRHGVVQQINPKGALWEQ